MKVIELGYEEAEVYFIGKELNNDMELFTEDVQEKIEKSVDLLNGYTVFGHCSAHFTPEFTEKGVLLKGSDFYLQGNDIKAHLLGCDKVYLFCATLGYGVDRIIRSFEVCDLSLGYYLDVLAGYLIEKYCDYVESVIGKAESEQDLTERFSCGYGDFPLDAQKDILRLVNAEKELGVKLTESGMMTPQKNCYCRNWYRQKS